MAKILDVHPGTIISDSLDLAINVTCSDVTVPFTPSPHTSHIVTVMWTPHIGAWRHLWTTPNAAHSRSVWSVHCLLPFHFVSSFICLF